MPGKKWFYTLIITNLVAFIDAIYLTFHHYKINILRPETKSFCSIGSVLDCDAVAASAYSEILGIPISTIGIFAYLFLLIFLLVALFSPRADKKRFISFAFLILVPMLFFSLFEFSVSVFDLGTICLMCSLLYICVIIMLISSKLALAQPIPTIWGNIKSFLVESWPFANNQFNTIVCIVALIASVLVAYTADLSLENRFINLANQKSIENRTKMAQAELEQFRDKFFELPVMKIDLDNVAYKGDTNAPITVVEYSDFQCPACAGRAESLVQLVKKFPGKVKLYYKYYPLDQHCNPEIKRPFHDNACQAAFYAHCAHEKGVFWEVHDILYKNRHDLSGDFFSGLKKSFKLDENCLKTSGPAQVKKNLTEANQMGVDYTPTIYLNGRKVSDIAKTTTDLDYIIKELLENK